MTKKQLCRDCKHLEHDGGCGIWCGIGGNNRNYDCRKFEKKEKISYKTIPKKQLINNCEKNKRFVQNNNLVMQNNEVYVVCGNEHSADVITTALNELIKENEELKQQLQKYDGWCNSVKRKNIDKVLKMSIFEIVEAFEYYEERIKDYERVLNGDVE